MVTGVYDAVPARDRIAAVVRHTPLLHSDSLQRGTGTPSWLKLECLQVTGSFKARGAANRILSLSQQERARGVVACSSGNHGYATAYMSRLAGAHACVCVPEWVDPAKLAAIRECGAEAVVQGATADESEAVSWRVRAERDAVYVHPFDDPAVIAGQGTIALEILEDLPQVAEVVVPLSGGGLLGGIAANMRARAPGVRIVGASAERAPVMMRSIQAGRLVQMPEVPTIATALAGNLGERNEHSMALVSEMVDEIVDVSEESILKAMRWAFREHRLVVEGGGAVALAAALEVLGPSPGPRAVVISGGNIDLGRFRDVVEVT